MRKPSMRLVERRRRRLDAAIDARRIRAVAALQRVVDEREVARRARERAEVIEARDEGIGSVPRQPAVGRLQAEDAAQRRRHADRAVGVRAEADRHLAGGDRGGRAARRAAGDAGEVVRVARRPVVRVLGREAVGVLVHVERADQDGAGALEAGDERRVDGGGRTLALDLRAGARRQAGDVEQVLDREGHAGERQRVARVVAVARAAGRAPRRARARARRRRR